MTTDRWIGNGIAGAVMADLVAHAGLSVVARREVKKSDRDILDPTRIGHVQCLPSRRMETT